MSKIETTARDAFPDILRGFALLGIALVNVPYLAINTLYGGLGSDLSQDSNYWTALTVAAVFQGKFYILFSFLFGYSANYIIRGERSNSRRWIARCFGLLLLGVLHFSLLFHGDILFVYGIFGLLLAAFLFRTDRIVKIWAWISFGIGAVGILSSALLTWLGELLLASLGKTFPSLDFDVALNQTLVSGGFLDNVPARIELWLLAAPQGLILQGPFVFAAFLLGLLVSRKQGLVNVNPPIMKKLALWGWLVGLPLQVVAAVILMQNEISPQYSAGIYLFAVSINFVAAPLLTAGLVGTLWMLSRNWKSGGLLGAAGRLSLTVYLSQSVVFSVLFSGWGFGLFGELGLLEVTLIAAATWLALAILAWLYLKVARKGPMENVLTWFSKTLGKSRPA
jgi:uncharacterized protein